MVIATSTTNKLKGKLSSTLEVMEGDTMTMKTNPKMPCGGSIYIELKTRGSYKESAEIAVSMEEALILIGKLSKGVNKILEANEITAEDRDPSM